MQPSCHETGFNSAHTVYHREVARPRIETVYDIATVAGVSVATVSRVLNQSPNVREETRQRVLAIIRKCGFRPNANARRLVGGRSGQVCFVLSNREVVHSFHSRILMGAEEYCRQKSYHVVFTTVEYTHDYEFPGDSLPRVIREHGSVEGLLLAGVNYPNLLRYLDAARIPYVLFGNNLVTGSLRLPNGPTVCFDEMQGGEQATMLLADVGHRDVVFAGDLSQPWYQRRYEGYRRAMHTLQLEPAVIDLRESVTAFELGRRAVSILLRRHPRATAVVAQDDETACGILDALKRLGLDVPGEISVVGYDDITEIRYIQPNLTTVRVPKEEIGWAMADRLLNRPNGKQSYRSLVLPTEIVIRDSCRKPGTVVNRFHRHSDQASTFERGEPNHAADDEAGHGTSHPAKVSA
jgi:DNA-binding LacI/PurR family transcriptional regulator